jgi:maltose O-acetyltransferase
MLFNIDEAASIMGSCRFDAVGGLSIDGPSVINRGCRIDTRGKVHIGKNVSISEEVTILTADHNVYDPYCKSRLAPVNIGDYVFIGTKAIILPGCNLGNGSVLAAGSVLTKSIPDYEIWGGTPARKIGDRPTNLAYKAYYRRFLH